MEEFLAERSYFRRSPHFEVAKIIVSLMPASPQILFQQQAFFYITLQSLRPLINIQYSG